jgi:hypothetical protein
MRKGKLHAGFLYEGKRQLGKWNDNINMNIKNWMVGCALDSSGSEYKQVVLVHVVINLLVT